MLDRSVVSLDLISERGKGGEGKWMRKGRQRDDMVWEDVR
jgi:hypothetical protein